MSSVKHTIKLFTKLFAFPRLIEVLIIILILSIFSSLVMVIIYGMQYFLTFLFFFILLTIGSAIFGKSIVISDHVFTFRRHLIASGIGTLFLVLPWIIFGFLEIYFSFLSSFFGFVLGSCLLTSLRILVMASIGISTFSRRILSNALQPFIAFLFAFYFFKIDSSKISFLMFDASLWITLAISFLFFVNLPLFISLKVHGLTLFRGFTSVWLGNDNTLLEKLLERISEESETYVDIIGFKSYKNDKLGIIINPGIHPGPFKNVGSSMLPTVLINTMRKSWSNVVVFHSTTTHGYNLPSHRLVDDVIDVINTRISSLETDKKYISNLIISEKDGIRVSFLLFEDTALAVISDNHCRYDDIDMTLGEYAKCKIEHIIEKPLMLVDAHNGIKEISESIYFESPYKKHILDVLFDAVEKSRKQQLKTFRVGFSSKSIDLPTELGYAPGGVSVVIFEVDSNYFAYVSFDGNNMAATFREKLRQSLQNTYNLNYLEITTTDNHLVNGIIPRGMGYFPIGEEGNTDYVLVKVSEALKDAFNNLQPAQYSFVRIFLKSKFMGHDNIQKLTDGVLVSAKIAKYYLLFASLLGIVLSYIFYILA